MSFDVVPMLDGNAIDLYYGDEKCNAMLDYVKQLGLTQNGGYEIEITNGLDVTRLDEAGKHIFGSGFWLQCNLIIPTKTHTEVVWVNNQNQFINLVNN